MFLYYEHQYVYQCTLKKVKSGDTVILILDLGFKLKLEIPLNLYCFNATGFGKGEQQKYKKKAEEFFSLNNGPFFVEVWQKNILGVYQGEVFCNTEPDDMGRCAKATLSQHQKIEWNVQDGN